MKNYELMSTVEQEHFLSHSCAELAQKMYHDCDKKGLEVFIKNLEVVIGHAKNCIDCIELLQKQGDAADKIFLLIDYLGKDGINEEFMSDLDEFVDKAHEALNEESVPELNKQEIKQICSQLNSVMDRKEHEYEEEQIKLVG